MREPCPSGCGPSVQVWRRRLGRDAEGGSSCTPSSTSPHAKTGVPPDRDDQRGCIARSAQGLVPTPGRSGRAGRRRFRRRSCPRQGVGRDSDRRLRAAATQARDVDTAASGAVGCAPATRSHDHSRFPRERAAIRPSLTPPRTNRGHLRAARQRPGAALPVGAENSDLAVPGRGRLLGGSSDGGRNRRSFFTPLASLLRLGRTTGPITKTPKPNRRQRSSSRGK
jgi:hypothetical protein